MAKIKVRPSHKVVHLTVRDRALVCMGASKYATIDRSDLPLLDGVIRWRAFKSARGPWYAVGWDQENRRHVLLHRLIAGCRSTAEQVDHISCDGWDNRRSNLRLATNQQNSFNARKTTKPTSSRFKGVYWSRRAKGWAAQIKVNGKAKFLGCHKVEEEAARVYDAAARQYFGEFARTNFDDIPRTLKAG